MNVLLTTDAFLPGAGGSGRSTATLASALVARGHHVRVVVGRTRLLGQREWEGVDVAEIALPEKTPLSSARERAFANGLVEASGEEAWDVVHAQHWLSASASAAALPKLPLVVTVRDYWPVCVWSTMLSGGEPCPGCSYGRRVVCVGRHRSWTWPLAPVLPPVMGRELARRARVLAGARGIIAVSQHVADALSGMEAEVIPNFVNDVEPEHPRPDDVPERYVLFVGKLEPNKAPDRLVPALARASLDVPLLVAGTGRLQPVIEAQAAREGVEVRFLGWVEEQRTRQLMQHAAAVLFPSRWQEPLSRVLVDGLASGAVLIAEPTGGTEDAIRHEQSGLIARGSEELGAALERVLSDDALEAALRHGARERAREVFSDAAVLPRVETLYASIAES